ncbi:MAG TPA: glycosyltransferase [Candidatus Sulfotelmatobacter sp.]|nr:glycosyltransferase [Candidatus Sulfotelmatobacter sp.]
MRVAMVSEHASPLATLGGEDAGGQNVHVSGLANALAQKGIEVVVYTRRDDPLLPRQVSVAPGVTVEHVDAGPARPIPKDELFAYMPAFAAQLAAEWSLDPPDLVHAHFWMSGYAAVMAGRPLDIPLIQTFHALGAVKRRHQGNADSSPRERLATERAILATADHIIATCSDEVAELTLLETDLQRVSVVPCGADLSVFSPHGPREARRDGLARLVSVGRLVERKGIADAIAALAHVPGCELVVAGGPPFEELAADPEVARLRTIACQLGVERRVEFRGRLNHEEVAALMRSADIVVSVPWYEPFGMTPIEAMACGVPVVGSAVGGLLDTVVNMRTGLLVPPRDPKTLAAALEELLGDDRLRAAMGRAGARRAQARYSWECVADLTLAVYHWTMGRSRTAPDLLVPEAGAEELMVS